MNPMKTYRMTTRIPVIALLASLSVLQARAWHDPSAHQPQGGAKAAGCSPATALTELDLNNVRALIETGGNMWENRAEANAAYEVPQTVDRSGAHSMFAGGLWMGGLSPDNQLKLAAVRYRDGNDYWPGPLTNTGDASVTSSTCVAYDRTWKTLRQDAEKHDAYFRCLNTPGCDVVAEFGVYTIPSIYFEWPALGDVSAGQDLYIAPFFDQGNDGDYEPEEGDFPGYDLDGVIDCKHKFRTDPIPLFGDQNIWWVFNDKGNTHTESGGQPIGMEVRAQAFAFSTNDEVNNMTFYNYTLINQGTQTLLNTYFGQYADPDLGCSDDDYVGCDVQRGLGYCYNGDDNDEGCNGAPGYGQQPPAIGIDFFEGPFQDYDNFDNPGPQNNLPLTECDLAVDENGIVYKGIGIGYGDTVPDNERYGMRAFMYYNRDNSPRGDPTIAVQYYNYLRSYWRDGTRMTYGGTGYEPNNASAIPANYMFPGSSDPIGWGTSCDPQSTWTEENSNNQPFDRRFVQSAGPFTLEPGAYNNITVGVVWGRAGGGGPMASVEVVRRADDKAQALFDNCFRLLNGPDAPDVDIQELNRELILYISNPIGSNNYKEAYTEFDPTIPPGEDQYYDFQGYKIYQVKDAEVSVADLGDVNKARLLRVVDLEDTIAQLVNWIQNPDINLPVATEMVNAPDTGVFHSFRVTEDLFAQGDPHLINYKTYYYMVLAYGHNEYEPFDPVVLTGQAYPYLAGRKAAKGQIHSYAGIPHPPESEANGTIQNSQYGDQIALTRIEGQGNGGLIIDITKETEDAIVSAAPWRAPIIHYRAGMSPARVKVVDPLKVPAAEFELYMLDTTDLPQISNHTTYDELNDAYWKLVNLSNGEEVFSDVAIRVGYEQLIPQWGLSITIDQTEYTNGNNYTEPLGWGAYEGYNPDLNDPNAFWYTGIPDIDGETPLNWIRSGLAVDDNITYKDYPDVDNDETYETMANGAWCPWPLAGDTAFQPADLSVRNTIQGSDLSEQHSLLFVFTPDKSKWSRSPVFETGDDEDLTIPEGVEKLRLRPVPSLDKNGKKSGDDGYDPTTGDLISGQSMSWFPGYAIDLETGERLNIAFGENSFWGPNGIGRDMVWNPNDQLISGEGFPIMGGCHWIYVFKNYRRQKNDDNQMPNYDEGRYLYERISSNQGADRTRVFRACSWVGSGLVRPGVTLNSMANGIVPYEVRVRLNINKPYFTYWPYEGAPTDPVVDIIDTTRNHGLPMYTFNTKTQAVATNVNDVEVEGLTNIAVVPNPYYAFSGYETSRLDNRVKFINLPRTCTISIFNVSGSLVRKYRKDNDLTYLDWDLKNSYNVPIAGGTYIIHVEVPGAGETVLKWFGVMRPVDLQNF
jgi:hypothetical protein